ncbi:MAG: HD domain-containing protein [Candidatus Poseidoniaceae archaeon]|jgi:putative hydrolase of HD superfamily|nr:HD domain-containing protein [Candidatus Poseidoniaceae archaeon]
MILIDDYCLGILYQSYLINEIAAIVMRDWFDLKHLLRTGWVRAGVDSPESVASHSWGMAILAMDLCPSDLDKMKVIEMCIVHDLPEAIVGDLTPHDDTSSKSSDEYAAMMKLAPQWINLLEEYEECLTKEARFVKYLDKLDMAVMARIYEDKQGLDLSEFIESAKETIGETNMV